MDTPPKGAQIAYRPMTPADIGQVHGIDMLSFAMPWSERSYRFEVVENQHSVTWVAEVEARGSKTIVGMIVIWAIIDEAHVATIATHPDFRGMSIGTGLLAHGLRAAYQRGARLAYLEVRRGNLVAQNLYFKFGFHIAGERPRYYQDNNEDALLMTLDSINPEALDELLRQKM